MTASASTRSNTSKSNQRLDRRQAAVGVGLALAIVLAAWLIGGRAGFGDIGKGGINRQFLPKEGEVAPDFTALDATGAEVRLSDFRGKPVWVNFWASWCGPCRHEFPFFQRVSTSTGRRVAFLGLNSGDSAAQARGFLAEFPVPYPSYEDPDERVARAVGAPANYPITIFYDERGREAFIRQGGYASERQLRDDIERYLGA